MTRQTNNRQSTPRGNNRSSFESATILSKEDALVLAIEREENRIFSECHWIDNDDIIGSHKTANNSATQCRRCRSESFVDVSIHEGKSIRRDCEKCGAFHSFLVWGGSDEN